MSIRYRYVMGLVSTKFCPETVPEASRNSARASLTAGPHTPRHVDRVPGADRAVAAIHRPRRAAGHAVPADRRRRARLLRLQRPKRTGRPQLGGMQIDRHAGRLYVNEEVAHNGRAYDLAQMRDMSNDPQNNDLAIEATNPGNGGIALVERELLVVLAGFQ